MVEFPRALIAEAVALVVIAPIAGIIVRRLWLLFAILFAAAGGSLAVHLVVGDSPSADSTVIAHAAMICAALALAGIGRLAAAWLSDPLDAVGASAAVAAVSAFGLFALGDLALRLPTSIVNAALAASPVVTITSAGSIDILRSELLYQLSPVAHREFAYPTWWTAAALHLGIAAAAVGASAVRIAAKVPPVRATL